MREIAPRTNGEQSDATDDFHDAFGHSHRRSLLRLLQRDQTSTVTDLIDCLRSPSERRPDERVAQESADCVRMQLTHLHLPKLVDVGYVEWDAESDVVTLSERGKAMTEAVRSQPPRGPSNCGRAR